MFLRRFAAPGYILLLSVIAHAQEPAAPRSVAAALSAFVAGPEAFRVEAIGLTASARGVTALEPTLPALATQPRVVLVGGLDGSAESTRAVLDVVAWRLSGDPGLRNRRRWQVAAVPCVLADQCDAGPRVPSAPAVSVPVFPPQQGFYDAPESRESRYLWRWVAMLAPDLVIDVRQGTRVEWRSNELARARLPQSEAADEASLAGALGRGTPSGLAPVAAVQISGPAAEVASALREFLDLRAPRSPSPMGRVALDRQARSPLAMARMLALRYPANPGMSYIPALSWSGAFRLSAITGDAQYRDRAITQMTPFLTGEKPAIAVPFLLTSVAGHQAFFDLAELTGNTTADGMARAAADAILSGGADEVVKQATSWTDDMFMATSVLARAARRTGEARYGDAVARLLSQYASRLQREDRLFIHAESGRHAWGRGNGFAAFGLMEALTHLPASWSGRTQTLESFRRLMAGLRRHQAPDGSWHQVIDEPGTYREFTVTAMVVAAMARGLRLGWLDASFESVVQRGWRAVQVRISDTGELADVCAGTGAGPNATGEYYRNRPALFGLDDRGGAMALTAALEMHALGAAK